MRRHNVFEGINPAELEGEEPPEPSWKKPVLVMVGVIMLVLIISLSFSDFIQGFVHSESVKQDALYFPSATIVFNGNTLEQLQNEFISNEHREIKACLFGKEYGGVYYIERVEFPEVIRANVIHIVSVPCPESTLIDLHSHPIDQCLASGQDISVYSELKRRNPNLRMMIMCSSTRFALV